MKIIHCADLHLDAKLSTNFDEKQRKQRNAELLHTFERMVDFAVKNGVGAVLIAGDMFDRKTVSKIVRDTVFNCIEKAENKEFYYVRGIHDENFEAVELPRNMHVFTDEWTSFDLGENITLSGSELTKNNCGYILSSIRNSPDCFNIVMLHGAATEITDKEDCLNINLKELRDKYIDYAALGHIHAPRWEKLDDRGIYCYSGCLEGRGFDECGERGFMLLDIDSSAHTFSHEFVPFAHRRLYEVCADVTDCKNNYDVLKKIEEATVGLADENLVKIVLQGKIDVALTLDEDFLLTGEALSRFYLAQVKSEYTRKVDYSVFEHDKSLKGEFVRSVNGAELTDEEKAEIIGLGIRLLSGEADF